MANSDQSPSSAYLRPVCVRSSCPPCIPLRSPPPSTLSPPAPVPSKTCSVTSAGTQWRAPCDQRYHQPCPPWESSWAITNPPVHGAVSSLADDAAGNVRGPGSASLTVAAVLPNDDASVTAVTSVTLRDRPPTGPIPASSTFVHPQVATCCTP
ncbi:hypothetical protein C8Q80DRAFT_1272223 [Daedaleopsis nitida]|nr:hypothetical protein C8Q80DRAFT_1272223 [Daedaleopsis nitida]